MPDPVHFILAPTIPVLDAYIMAFLRENPIASAIIVAALYRLVKWTRWKWDDRLLNKVVESVTRDEKG